MPPIQSILQSTMAIQAAGLAGHAYAAAKKKKNRMGAMMGSMIGTTVGASMLGAEGNVIAGLTI